MHAARASAFYHNNYRGMNVASVGDISDVDLVKNRGGTAAFDSPIKGCRDGFRSRDFGLNRPPPPRRKRDNSGERPESSPRYGPHTIQL